eukprot:gb/GECG01012728.1/.p1 GENE.gb/GECG01012728.1/~~gb/GECG01012728.1/.p1  ORF type:complete len:157 (+),score=10.28 gb/GECG01012728.1/:1-471(+)
MILAKRCIMVEDIRCLRQGAISSHQIRIHMETCRTHTTCIRIHMCMKAEEGHNMPQGGIIQMKPATVLDSDLTASRGTKVEAEAVRINAAIILINTRAHVPGIVDPLTEEMGIKGGVEAEEEGVNRTDRPQATRMAAPITSRRINLRDKFSFEKQH